jgi:hypothetical protein
MSHRMAMVVSVVFTTLMVVGVVVARDRLFGSDGAAGQAQVAPTATAAAETGVVTATGDPRVVEVTLPSSLPGVGDRDDDSSARSAGPWSDDDDDDEHDDDEHEDDDDEHEDDDDD